MFQSKEKIKNHIDSDPLLAGDALPLTMYEWFRRIYNRVNFLL